MSRLRYDPQNLNPGVNEMQKILIILTTLLLVSACAHKIEVQQGNLVTLDKVSQLSLGMKQQQVRFLLGTPLLQDPFHKDRWDYFYSLADGGALKTQRRVSLYFSSGRLIRIEKKGDIPATEAEAIAEKARE